MDFALILVVLTGLTGFVWAVDSLFFRKRRLALAGAGFGVAGEQQAAAAPAARDPVIVEYSKSFFPVILAVLLIRSFLVEPFTIPSSSMVPTLLIGDFILVNKYSYGVRLPVVHTKILDVGEPQRGDIVVFRPPTHPDKNYVKRLVGLPGDKISYVNDVLYVNGVAMQQTPVGRYFGEGSNSESTGGDLRKESLLGIEHQILLRGGRGLLPGGTWEIPPGQYFMMGDNRDNSEDSRAWGLVPEQNLVGRAFFVWMHWDWKIRGFVSWDRIGMKLG
ncbi:MAG: signal peptidase I [Xanthomonadales bacterium PRO6]|nr:Signal peptidase I [Xanthomonadales bacterium]MCE7931549.1 signal peptidase I [Xanthomonadales bacterium PRO6]